MRGIGAKRARVLAGWLVGGIAVFLTGPFAAEDLRAGLVPGGRAPHLILGYTGDVIGYIDPCG